MHSLVELTMVTDSCRPSSKYLNKWLLLPTRDTDRLRGWIDWWPWQNPHPSIYDAKSHIVSFIYSLYSLSCAENWVPPFSLTMFVVSGKKPRGNPCWDKENMHTPHRKDPACPWVRAQNLFFFFVATVQQCLPLSRKIVCCVNLDNSLDHGTETICTITQAYNSSLICWQPN